MHPNRDWILWTDCLGGLCLGLIVLLIHPLLSQLEGLPKATIVCMGIANVSYGSYSLFVTNRKPRSIRFIQLLALANIAWLFACLAIVLLSIQHITYIGVILILGEGLYVATLGIIEWNLRSILAHKV
jgi:hypothetical protein